jgi:D-alanine--poly(phosphoribitol) ligase subunit 1
VPGCSRAVTLKLDCSSLVAFVAPTTVDPDAARRAVADALPYYCVPVAVHALAELPVTSRGKVDKALLMELGRVHRAGPDPVPGGPLPAEPLPAEPLPSPALQAQAVRA